jgi:2-polyprenyl-3-methyl-5-hydroxy-6-metoxy-1,4-benzoquinol methylase
MSKKINEHLQRLDANNMVYLQPTDDRQIDQLFMKLVCEFCMDYANGENVLEMGAGDQVMTPLLCKKYKSVTTIEGSQTLLENLRDKLSSTQNWRGIHTLFEDYIPQDRYDLVLCTYVLEHVEYPSDVLRLIADKWLTPDGNVVIVVPHALSLHRRLAQQIGLVSHLSELGSTDVALEHFHCFSFVEMEKLIAQSGLRIKKRSGMFCKPLPNIDLSALSQRQLEGLFRLGCELPIEYSAALFYLCGKS